MQAESCRRERQHAAELAAAENADGRAGLEQGFNLWFLGDGLCLPCAPGVEPLGDLRVRQRQHRGRQQCGVDRARLADGQRADRDAARHLHDRQQRILAFQGMRIDRHTEHRQWCHRRRHAGQVGGSAGPRDNHLEAFVAGAMGEVVQPLRRAMRRDDQRLIADLERVEGFGGVFHRGPVGLTAHDDRDRFFSHCAPTIPHPWRKEARDYRFRPPAGKAKAL